MKNLKFKLLSIAVLSSLISGCTTLSVEQIRARDEATCASYGFKAKTNDFANCLLQLDLSRQADRREWRQSQQTIIIPAPVYRPILL